MQRGDKGPHPSEGEIKRAKKGEEKNEGPFKRKGKNIGDSKQKGKKGSTKIEQHLARHKRWLPPAKGRKRWVKNIQKRDRRENRKLETGGPRLATATVVARGAGNWKSPLGKKKKNEKKRK